MHPAATDPPPTTHTGPQHDIRRRITRWSISGTRAMTVSRARRSRAAAMIAIVTGCLLGTATAAHAAVPVFTPAQGSPFLTGDGAVALTFARDGSLLMTANQVDNTVSSFSVSYPGGQLTQVPGSPFPAGGNGPTAIAASPNSKFVAVTSSNSLVEPLNSLSVLAVSASGALTQAPGSPTDPGRSPSAVAWSPNLPVLAITDTDDNALAPYLISGAGRPTALNTFSLNIPNYIGQPSALAFSPDGDLLAVTDGATNTVRIFKVDTSSGFTEVGSPVTVGAVPLSVAFNAAGTLLATTSEDDDSVSLFSVTPTGSITPVSGSPFSTGSGSGPVDAAFSPDGSMLATANIDNGTASVFSIGADETLTPVPGTPLTIAVSNEGIGSEPEWVAFSPNGHLLTTANSGSDFYDTGTVSVFNISQPTLSTPPPTSGCPAHHHRCCGGRPRHPHHQPPTSQRS